MPTNIAWKLNVAVPSGPTLNIASAVPVDAYDLITVTVPHTTATPPDEIEVDVQPSAADQVRLLVVRSTQYGDNLKYKVHATGNPERVLNDTLFLVGTGSMELLGADPDKVFFINTLGSEVKIEIIVGRQATS